MHGGRLRTAWRMVAGAALGLLVLGAYWPGRLPGASIGVDIFCVVAGALMAQALLIDRERPLGEVGTAIARLVLPTMFVLVVVAIGVQRWFEVPAWELALGDVRRAAIGIVNLQPVEPTSAVAWLWIVALAAQSLLLIWVLRVVQDRVGTRTAVLTLAVASAGSFAVWLFGSAGAQSAGRFWPVGVGALLAFVVQRRPMPPLPASVLVGVIGLGVGVFAVLGSSGRATVVLGVVAGVALVVLGGAHLSPALLFGSRLTGILAWISWVVFCAAWPALQIATAAVGHDLGLRSRVELLALVLGAAMGAVLVVTGLLTALRGRIWRPVLVVATVAAAVLVTVPGLQRVEAIETDADRVDALLAADVPECFGADTMGALIEGRACDNPDLDGTIHLDPARMGEDFEPFIECWSQPYDADLDICDLGPAEGAPRVLLLGDSHARVMLGAFQRLADHGVLSVSSALKASCAWSTLPIRQKGDPLRVRLCDEWRARLADWLDEHAAEYDVIVTTAYSGRMKGPESRRVEGLVEAWTPTAKSGVPIVALRDNPRMPGNPNDCLATTDPQDWAACDVPAEEALTEFDPFGPAAKQVDGVHYIDTAPFYCHDGTCPAVIGGVGVFRDYNHVSSTYAESLAPTLYRAIARTGVFDGVAQSAATAATRMQH